MIKLTGNYENLTAEQCKELRNLIKSMHDPDTIETYVLSQELFNPLLWKYLTIYAIWYNQDVGDKVLIMCMDAIANAYADYVDC